MNSSLVSIGVPNYNYAHYIEQALNSIVNQTYQNIELIIVDDCSTDDSVKFINDWIKQYNGPVKINFIKNTTNQGLTKVCNIILHHASGKYFQTLDADDILLPFKIEQQVKVLEQNPGCAWIYSDISIVNAQGEKQNNGYLERIGYDKNNMPEGNIFSALFDFNFIPLPSVLINTARAREVGGFDETLQVQDYYLWLKLAEKYQTVYYPHVTALYRLHGNSMSNNVASNPKSVDSIMSILYRYYKSSGEEIQKKIRKNIHYSCLYLYEFDYPTAKKWLRIDSLINPGIKPVFFFIARSLGIPFSFFKKIKTLIHK